ncbi:MAG: acetate kinase, partial [Hydrogenophilales bacterium 16-62-9]
MSILVVNSGSSSLKASLFTAGGGRRDFRFEHIGLGRLPDHRAAFAALMHELGAETPAAVGHRLVHGGEITEAARLIDDAERMRLESVVALAPLHLPGNLLGVDLCRERFDVPQIACFDTAFHVTLPELARRLPIPQSLGLRRYGFHGLNYAHVA